jgi:galactose mutarotase-like enzyme
MSQESCHLSEHRLPQRYRAVTLENGLISVTVMPEKGADIYSIFYKPRKLDVLWKSPWGLKRPIEGVHSTGASTSAAWMEHYPGGWQEIFPNGGDECTYKGAPMNFHGEASTLPWEFNVVQADESTISVEFFVQLFRSPFTVSRILTIERGSPVISIKEKIQNLAEEEMHFMWGHHPAFGAPFLAEGCRIQVPARTFRTHPTTDSSASRLREDYSTLWPYAETVQGEKVDMSVVPPSHQRIVEMGYVTDLDAGWYSIFNPEYDLGFGMSWNKEVFPHIWYWQELKGSFGYPFYGRCYTMALEPFNCIPGTGLENAVAGGHAPQLQPGGTLEAELAVVFYEGESKLANITQDGEVVRA